jgi:hypothetical protein
LRFRSPQTRPLLGGAAFAFLSLATLGCSSSASSGVAADSASASTLQIATTAPPTTIVSSINGADALAKALAALGPNYHFTSTFVVNGAQTIVADGDRIGDGSRLTITQSGATVHYVVLPTASYAQPEGGDWQLQDTPPASTDSIKALASPSAVGVLVDDGTKIRLQVTVDAAALGVGTGTANLQAVIVGGVLTEVDYGTPVKGGGIASVASVFKAPIDATPVAAPI